VDTFKTGNLICPAAKGVDDSKLQGTELLKYHKRILEFYTQEREAVSAAIQERMVNYKVMGLYGSGLVRVTRTTLLRRLLLPSTESASPSSSMRSLIGAAGVIMTLEQKAARCVKFCQQGDMCHVNMVRERENTGHDGWSPVQHPLWLLFEIELNLMIRKVPVDVANQMISPPTGEHAVMQLNMGEGKTAVIVPLLALSLANRKDVSRVTVLRSLYKTDEVDEDGEGRALISLQDWLYENVRDILD